MLSQCLARSSGTEVRIRVPTVFLVVYFTTGTLPTTKGTVKGPLADLFRVQGPPNAGKNGFRSLRPPTWARKHDSARTNAPGAAMRKPGDATMISWRSRSSCSSRFAACRPIIGSMSPRRAWTTGVSEAPVDSRAGGGGGGGGRCFHKGKGRVGPPIGLNML